MGLLAARNAGMEVSDEVLDAGLEYMRRSTGQDGSVAYSAWLRLQMARDRSSALQWAGPSEDLQALSAQPRC